MSKKPTIKDVAQRAGVATATVARVLHNKGYVAEKTKIKVNKAVEETGYSINSIASSLKRSQSNIIGHVLQSTIPNPFFAKVANGVEAYAHKHGYTTLTYNVHGSIDAERRGVQTFLGWRADGIIFTGPLESKNVEYAMKALVPVVQVERPRNHKSNRIIVDNYSGAVSAMEHLLDLGHKRIAYIGEKPGSQKNTYADYVEEERLGAYVDTLAQRGLMDDKYISFGSPYTMDLNSAQGHGYDTMKMWLQNNIVPTAIFASNDILAAGALQAIYEFGLSVPNDISIIGFDDTLSPFLAPLLTTVSLPAYELGNEAARIIIENIENTKTAEKIQVKKLDTELVIRNSTGPLKNT